MLTTAFALRYREPAFPATLDWYPTDKKDTEPRAGLEYLAQEEAPEVLFYDPNEDPVYAKDIVVLRGLSAQKFNERQGQVQRKDPEQEGRFAVQLLDDHSRKKEKKMISIKRENLYAMASTPLQSAVLRGMLQETRHDFFQELLDRTCHVEIQKKETWSNVEHLYGQCALVTCINLVERSYPPWQEALDLAYNLLTEGGNFVQFDKVHFHGFGNVVAMEQYVYGKGMNMILEQGSDAYDKESGFAMMLWKRFLRATTE